MLAGDGVCMLLFFTFLGGHHDAQPRNGTMWISLRSPFPMGETRSFGGSSPAEK